LHTLTTATDQIQKIIVLNAPHERVWRAISDATQFGKWFGIRFDGAFVPGAAITGKLTRSVVDPDPPGKYEGFAFDFKIEHIEPMRLFSYRWHPCALDPNVDYSSEPMTLVTFELEDAAGGTKLTITESGFDSIPLERRVAAFQANSGGWTDQVEFIEKYLALPPA